MTQRPSASISQLYKGPLLMPLGIRNVPSGCGSENIAQTEHRETAGAGAPHTRWAHKLLSAVCSAKASTCR
jgi:hypothetical protein